MPHATPDVSLASPSEPSLLRSTLLAALTLMLFTCLLGGLYARQDARERTSGKVSSVGSLPLSR